MTIRDKTIKELLVKNITKVMIWPTRVSIEKMRNELAKIGTLIKTTHTAFPEGTKFLFSAVIMTAPEYRKRFTQLGTTWKFTKPNKPATYNPSIKTSASGVTKAQKEAPWKLRRDKHEVYLGIEDMRKEKILQAYYRSLLESIEDNEINFNHKMAKDIPDHLKN